jgi:hypothetical protein
LTRALAAAIPTVTRAEINDDSDAPSPHYGEHRLAHGARGIPLILDAHEPNPEMIERLARTEPVRDAPRQLVSFRTGTRANAG